MKPLLVTSGEPAGIGPDLCLSLAKERLPIVILGDKALLVARAEKLNQKVVFETYSPHVPVIPKEDHLTIFSIPCPKSVIPGQLNPLNSTYVMEMLTTAASRCFQKEFSAVVTAPVNKAVINEAGIDFTGHTEFFADYFKVKQVVMMLVCRTMKIALVTTHLPLRKVADKLSIPLISSVITILHRELIKYFDSKNPQILVAGLNPHAGESGYLGREEIEIVEPALRELRSMGLEVEGPFPADTLFSPANLKRADVFLTMYHDQGLPVIKYASFGSAVNVTLGLPIIRTSVDHGTALDRAGTGTAETGSLIEAVDLAWQMAKTQERFCATN